MAEVAQSHPGAAAEGSARRASLPLRPVMLVGAGVLGLGIFLVVAAGARLDVPTTGLLLVGVALIGCLRTLHRMVGALARDNLEVVVDSESEYGGASERELREERRRLLRALNELRFDHEMGKLSSTDYETVRQGYELRALEVMRALEGGRSLHPQLAVRLGLAPVEPADPIAVTSADPAAPEEDDAAAKPEPAAATAAEVVATADAPSPSPDATSRTCLTCDGQNDADARFCKHCGKELVA